MLADIDDPRADACIAELQSLSVPCEYYHIDVTDEAAVNGQVARIAATYDQLDAVVNRGWLGGRSRFEGRNDRNLPQRAGFEP